MTSEELDIDEIIAANMTVTDHLLRDAIRGVVIDAMNKAAEREREACAEVATNWRCNGMPRRALGDAIRARGHVKESTKPLTRSDNVLNKDGIRWEVEP